MMVRALRAFLLTGCLALPAGAVSVDDIAEDEVKEATKVESAKADLALCAPHLEELRYRADAEAMHDAVTDPQCRKAILGAQEAGLTKEEIVNILMGAVDIPDPRGFTTDHGGPPVLID